MRLTLCFLVGLAALSASAAAQQSETKPRVSQKSSPFDALNSSEVGVVRQGIEQAERLKTQAAGKALAERIRRGLPPELLEPAVGALLSIGGGSAKQLLPELARHQKATVRCQAAEGIGKLGPTGAAGMLGGLLGDKDATVRAAAAQAFLKVGPAPVMPQLVTAASLGDDAAAQVVAAKARPTDAPAVREHLAAPLAPAWASCLEKLLVRSDWPLKARLGLVDKLLADTGPVGTVMLERVVAGLDKKDPARRAYIDKLSATEPQEKNP